MEKIISPLRFKKSNYVIRLFSNNNLVEFNRTNQVTDTATEQLFF